MGLKTRWTRNFAPVCKRAAAPVCQDEGFVGLSFIWAFYFVPGSSSSLNRGCSSFFSSGTTGSLIASAFVQGALAHRKCVTRFDLAPVLADRKIECCFNALHVASESRTCIWHVPLLLDCMPCNGTYTCRVG